MTAFENNASLNSEASLNDLYHLQPQFIVIRNFFSPVEVDSILADLSTVEEGKISFSAPGYGVYPRCGFNTANLEESADVYFDSTGQSIQELANHFSVDMLEKFKTTFKKHNHSKDCSVMKGPNEESFNPFNFRIMDVRVGEKATSNIHNGSYITSLCSKGTYKHLTEEVDFENQLSFFAVLKNAESGGEITVYNYPRRNYPELKDKKILQSVDGETVDLEAGGDKTTISMQPGDLIIFPGGQLWHRVEPVSGGKRITLGGFLAKTFKNDNWYFWI